MRAQSIHWLRENARELSPHRVLVIDTETVPDDPADPDHQSLLLWCARLTRRHGVEPKRPRTEDYRGRTAPELADLVERLARSDATLWAMTHNLNFDLAVTQLPVHLTDRGWRITESALTTDDPWVRLARRSHRLTIADTASWLPTSVEELGRLIGHPKPPLPAPDDDLDDWWRRCEGDVAITARAILSVMDWWDGARVGNWSITGPATGWSSYRHRKPTPRVLVDPDPDARAWEARAVSGGRREVRRVGALPPGLYADLDIVTAHLTAMSALALPAQRLLAFDQLETDSPWLAHPLMDVMAECTVETAAPRYPWHHDGSTWYPVGRFDTILAGPELREARARGELVRIGPGRLYQTSEHMADWALWVAGLLDPAITDVPPAVRVMAKQWSRSVPGKWAGHTSEVVERVPDARPGWLVEQLVIMPERRDAWSLLVGGERWTIVRDLWADDAFPAILATIQSATRVALSRLVDMLGPAVVSMNTDGLIVDVRQVLAHVRDEPIPSTLRDGPAIRELDALVAAWQPVLAPFTARVKRAARDARILSPQHVILGGERRLAGIPRRATELANGRFTFTQWPKLRAQLATPSGPGYRTHQGHADLSAIPPLGWLLADGTVLPPRIHATAAGLVSWSIPTADLDTHGGLAPLDRQHPTLRYWAGGAAWAA